MGEARVNVHFSTEEWYRERGMYRIGEVWEWRGHVYLLLERNVAKEVWATIRTENQQIWEAFSLIDGVPCQIRMHPNVYDDVDKWVKLS